MGTYYSRSWDGRLFTLLWDCDEVAVDIPDYKAGYGPLVIIQDYEDGTLVITSTDWLTEEYELAPDPNIELIIENE